MPSWHRARALEISRLTSSCWLKPAKRLIVDGPLDLSLLCLMALWFQGGSNWFKETAFVWLMTSRFLESMTQPSHRTRLTCTWWIHLRQWSENFSCVAMKQEWPAIWWPKRTIWKMCTNRFPFVQITCDFLTFVFPIVSLEGQKFTNYVSYPSVPHTMYTISFVWPGYCTRFVLGIFFFW